MRIVSLISSATEILHALGLGDDVLAVSHECDFPRSVLDKPRATFSKVDSRLASGEIDTQVKTLLADGEPLYGLDVQLLIQLRPDLIVTQAQCDVCAVRHQDVVETVRGTPALRDTKIVALNPQSIGDVLSDIHTLGRATGRALRRIARSRGCCRHRRASFARAMWSPCWRQRPTRCSTSVMCACGCR